MLFWYVTFAEPNYGYDDFAKVNDGFNVKLLNLSGNHIYNAHLLLPKRLLLYPV